MNSEYREFLESKANTGRPEPTGDFVIPDFLYDFQKHIVNWTLSLGRAAMFADCGLGKTPMQLVWADNIHRITGKKILILTPLAVSSQTIKEAEKFGIEAVKSRDGASKSPITVTNYENLHKFSSDGFGGVVCDESSILKSFDGSYRGQINEFMRTVPYRLLATATAAPNDYTELGTSSEALGYLGHIDMLNMFFKNQQGNSAMKRHYGEAPKWRFKGHAEQRFWRWVTSWAIATRKPSDIGFEDGAFNLTNLIDNEHWVKDIRPPSDMLFTLPAINLFEQREERKRTINERCEYAASLVTDTGKPAVVWCHMNAEGDLLEKLIPDAIQVSGRDSVDAKEEKLVSFSEGKARVIITKPKIGAWGLNWQHCAHVVYFPSHSYEQYYQAVRRCWRFGQKRDVVVDIVATEGERKVMENMRRKSEAAGVMFSNLLGEMNNSMSINRIDKLTNKQEIPLWV